MPNPESQVSPDLIPPLDPELLSLSEIEMTFLRTYISPDDHKVRERILDIQKRAYAEYPYPCVRAFNFVNLFMAENPIYSTVVDAGRGGHTLFLDLGCHMGTDVRKLVCDGYPASNVVGCDLRPQYFDFGYELFGDADTCPIRFFADNIFDVPFTIFDFPGTTVVPDLTQGTIAQNPPAFDSAAKLSQLCGTLTHIYTGALFHLFNEEAQGTLALQLAELLKRSPGATVFGRHQGLEKDGKIDDHLGR
ncbi:hypothetical protein GSI_10709 [Ganoderma sinense ZZ0214-1]|uniref:Methyltransferase domain-containing protein n=1 Tax=Ganoderma sinense ZZ0214-1 TaxID=1077348 RepID=A0A2G8S1W9_9APHY|nr:hypothetical protein GSI_10709 [Ganoderma sinense ZZ0214-1]